MKKKLTIMFSCLAAALICTAAVLLMLRYQSRGEVLRTGICYDNGSYYLLHLREKGLRKTKLLEGGAGGILLSPDGRYAAVQVRQGAKDYTAAVFDMNAPEAPVFTVPCNDNALLLTNDARLLAFSSEDRLLRCIGRDEVQILAENVTALGQVLDENTLYFFTEIDGSFDLYTMDLLTFEPSLLLDRADPTSLQVSRNAEGSVAVCAAQIETLTGTRYDLVTDELAEADRHSDSEAAQKRNEQRKMLQAESVSHEVATVHRWVDGQYAGYVNGIYGDYYADAATGCVLHRISTLIAPQLDLQEITGVHVNNKFIWYLYEGAGRVKVDALEGRSELKNVLFGGGAVTIGDTLSIDLATCQPIELTLDERPQALCTVLDENGLSVTYTLSRGGAVYRTQEGQTELLSRGAHKLYIPYVLLPDGTKQQTGSIYLLKQEARMDDPDLPYQKNDQWNSQPDCLIHWHAGEETVILKIKENNSPLWNNTGGFTPLSSLPDGTLVAFAGGTTWVIGPERSERLTLMSRNILWFGAHSVLTLE